MPQTFFTCPYNPSQTFLFTFPDYWNKTKIKFQRFSLVVVPPRRKIGGSFLLTGPRGNFGNIKTVRKINLEREKVVDTDRREERRRIACSSHQRATLDNKQQFKILALPQHFNTFLIEETTVISVIPLFLFFCFRLLREQ